MIRTHYLAAIVDAPLPMYRYSDKDFLNLLKTAIADAELHPVGELCVSFEPQGLSAVVLLRESYVALHFWPEKRKVLVDVHVCDFHEDNLDKACSLALTLATHIGDGQAKWKYFLMKG